MKRLIAVVVLILGAGTAALWWWHNHRMAAAVAALQQRHAAARAEQARLARLLPSSDAPHLPHNEALRRELEAAVERIHGLGFLRPIEYRTMASGEFRQFMSRRLREVYTEAELRNYSRAMALLGLVPAGTDIGAVILGLYNEQVAAFYDQHRGELYTFSDFTLSENLDRMMLVHEMTHALQDQHFTLKNFPLETKDNDDLALATAALIEGDATFLMTLWYMNTLSATFDWKSFFRDLGGMFGQNAEQLASAPAYFRETLLFPYQQGNEFVLALYSEGGYDAINRAFARPPVSTEQVLHPHKFLRREEPIAVRLPELSIEGWKPILRNTLGELGIRLLLREQLSPFESNRAAQGWGGDRYVVFEDDREQLVLLWISAWDSESDAAEFAESLEAALRERLLPNETGRPAAPAGNPGLVRFGNLPLQAAVRRTGSTVTVLLGPSEAVEKILVALPGP